ncbi:hypothetical protein DID75_02690 [Candidatus Marinamargulisbacteria bacterium SCGC AG-410-N11]|nr:hypothetical protein DID75_02690 [Candidatus Marinamargulisbacteria bacterium SCGC AG-410-N11]
MFLCQQLRLSRVAIEGTRTHYKLFKNNSINASQGLENLRLFSTKNPPFGKKGPSFNYNLSREKIMDLLRSPEGIKTADLLSHSANSNQEAWNYAKEGNFLKSRSKLVEALDHDLSAQITCKPKHPGIYNALVHTQFPTEKNSRDNLDLLLKGVESKK